MIVETDPAAKKLDAIVAYRFISRDQAYVQRSSTPFSY
jgi:hypothetical protein